MITRRSLLPPQAPRAAFGALVKGEFLLAWRTPNGLAVGLGLPVLLLVVYGLLPPFHQSLSDLGGLTLFEVYFPVLIALVIAALGFNSLPSPLATYREQGILRRLSTTPVPPAWVLGAQLVVNLALAVLAMLILVVVGMAAFGLAGPRSAGGLVLAILLAIAAIFALGLCIAAVARGAQMATVLGGLSFVALMFFAGLWVPRAAMPGVLRDVSDWTPLGAAVEAIQAALQTGFPPVRALLVLAAYAVVFGWLAVRFFRWE
jgi:ABC-2 type transport system permease protein